jgi:hypothetical protein
MAWFEFGAIFRSLFSNVGALALREQQLKSRITNLATNSGGTSENN